MDFFGETPTYVVAVESKFTEILSPSAARFSDAYDRKVEESAEPGWASLFLLLKRNPTAFRFADAAQLLKHYLGIRSRLGGGRRGWLHYVFWEPTNWVDIPEYLAHRAELDDIAGLIGPSSVTLLPASYDDVWARWRRSSMWVGMAEHLARLEQRYQIALRVGAN